MYQRLLKFAKPFRHEEEMKNEKPDGDQVRRNGNASGRRMAFLHGFERRDPGSCFLQGCHPLRKPDLLTKL